jgi:hypothetical protein
MPEEENNFDYAHLNKRIEQAKKDPMFGITKDDVQELTDSWMTSYNNLRKPNRRTIASNINYPEFLKLIAKYPHIKTNVGYMIYVKKCVLSILGGEGAYCDEMTFEIAILDSKSGFITKDYEPAADSFQMSLHYQDLVDLDNIIKWCESRE